MLTRTVIVVAATAVVAGCVDSQRLRSNLGGPPATAEKAPNPKTQTLASRVLGAIALETVTERKPDPGRLYELRR